MMLLCGQSSNLDGKSTRLYFVDDIQDVSARTVGGKVTFQHRGGGGGVVRLLRPPLATGLSLLLLSWMRCTKLKATNLCPTKGELL